MKLPELKKNWNEFGRRDPLWAILADPEKRNHRWNVDEFFKTGERDVQAILSYIEALPFSLKHGAALDFGCGVGRLTQALSARFDSTYGVDIARSMIRLARKLNRHGRRCRYLLNERDDLRLFESGKFDFICSLITLQHMKPAYSKSYILEFLRVLAPGGLLFFQLPSQHKTAPALNLQPDEDEEAGASSSREPGRILGLYEKALELYRERVSVKEFEPVMEMYSVSRDEVLRLVQESGATVINVQDDFSCGPDWISFRYFITK